MCATKNEDRLPESRYSGVLNRSDRIPDSKGDSLAKVEVASSIPIIHSRESVLADGSRRFPILRAVPIGPSRRSFTQDFADLVRSGVQRRPEAGRCHDRMHRPPYRSDKLGEGAFGVSARHTVLVQGSR